MVVSSSRFASSNFDRPRIIHVLLPRAETLRPVLEYAWNGAAAVGAEVWIPVPARPVRRPHRWWGRITGRRRYPADLEGALERLRPTPRLIPYLPVPGRSLQSAAAAVALKLRRSNPASPTVLQGSILDEGGYVAVQAGRWMGVPTVAVAHGSDAARLASPGPYSGPAARGLFAVHWSTRLLAVSNHVARPLRRLGREVEVVPFAGFADAFPLHPPPPGPPWRLLFVGRVGPAKGFDLLLAALRLIHRRPWRLEVIGPAERGYDPIRAIEASGFPKRVRWSGARPQAEVAEGFRAAHALVLPSRAEGLGNVAVEAILTGRPALVSAVGGLVEIPGAIQVRDRHPSAWATALSNLMDGLPEWRPEPSRQAVLPLTWERQAPRMEHIYRGLLRSQGM
ncbi:MAG: glycosyltransferase family 4 protein [Myxococcota bacterium]